MKAANQPRKLSSFWIGPLCAGTCLATGYEITQRLIISPVNLKEPSTELFSGQKPFPGERLEAFKKRHSSIEINKDPDPRLPTQETKRPSSKSNTLLENEMQKVLDALEGNWGIYNISKPVNSNSLLKPSNGSNLTSPMIQPVFKKHNFDELFNTLTEP